MEHYRTTDIAQIVSAKFPKLRRTITNITETFYEIYRTERQRVFSVKSLPALDIIVAQIISIYKYEPDPTYRDTRIRELFQQYYQTADDIKNGLIIRFPAKDIASIQKLRYGTSTVRVLAHNDWIAPKDRAGRVEQAIIDFKAIYIYNSLTQFGNHKVPALDALIANICKIMREKNTNIPDVYFVNSSNINDGLKLQEDLFDQYYKLGDSLVNTDIYVDARLKVRELDDTDYFTEKRGSTVASNSIERDRHSGCKQQ